MNPKIKSITIEFSEIVKLEPPKQRVSYFGMIRTRKNNLVETLKSPVYYSLSAAEDWISYKIIELTK